MTIQIQTEGTCNCPKGQCAHFVEPDTDCVYRLSGIVETAPCPICHPTGSGTTWHQDGECLRCRKAKY
jgi:hypothetical protein